MQTVGCCEGAGEVGKRATVDDSGAVQEGLRENAHPLACERESSEVPSTIAFDR